MRDNGTMIPDSGACMACIGWEFPSTRARVLSLIGASYVTWACASANLVCHGRADALSPMSVKPVRPCSHLVISSEKPDVQSNVKSCFERVHHWVC